MYNRSIIKSLSALLLLLVFAFSITPKKTWHDLIATHQDGKKPSYDYSAQGDQLHKSVIHCSCELQVAESPFVDIAIGLDLGLPPARSICYIGSSQDSHDQQTHFYGLRGPPATV